jgi:oligosaccharide repeat unit polymerase
MNSIITAVYLFLLLFFHFLYLFDSSGNQFGVYSISIGLTLLFVLTCIRLNCKRRPQIYKNIANASYILLVGLLIVNFQTIANTIVGFAPISYYLNSYDYSLYTGKVTFMSCMAVCSMVWAHSVYNPKKKIIKNDIYINVGNLWIYLSLAAFIAFLLHINVSFFISGEDYFNSGGYDREIKSYAVYEVLFDVFNTISLASIIKRNSSYRIQNFFEFIKKLPWIYTAINCIYVFLRLVSGDRGPVIYTLLMFFFAFIYMTKIRLKPILIVLLGIIAIFSIAMLNVMRSEDSSLNLTDRILYGLQDRQGKIEQNSISPYTQELASSVNCNFIAINDIHKGKTDYKYGQYSFLQLLGAIPGFSSIYQKFFGANYMGSGEYITRSYSGNYYSYGLGTTPVAELYLDFGCIGVILGFILIGIVYKHVDYKLLSKRDSSMISLILFLKFASMCIYLPRSSLFFIATKGFYIVFFYMSITLILSLFSKKVINSNKITL